MALCRMKVSMGCVGGDLYPESLFGPLFPLQLWFTRTNSASIAAPGPFSISSFLLFPGLLCLESFPFSLQYVKLCSLLCGEVAASPNEIHSGMVGIFSDCVAFPNRCSICKRQAEEALPIDKEERRMSVSRPGLLNSLRTEDHAGMSPSWSLLWPM